MYHRVACGRLYLYGRDREFHAFVPEGAPQPVLRTVRGIASRGPSVGTWWYTPMSGERGKLFCSAEDGTWERFDDLPTLERAYLQLFHRLRSVDRLRSAHLRHNGVTVHRWTEEGEEGGD